MSSTINISSNSASWSFPSPARSKLGFLAKSTNGGGQYQPGGSRARSGSDSDSLGVTEPEYKRPRLDHPADDHGIGQLIDNYVATCLQQKIWPILMRVYACYGLVEQAKLDAVKNQVFSELSADPNFRSELATGNGQLSAEYERQLTPQVELQVAKLVKPQQQLVVKTQPQPQLYVQPPLQPQLPAPAPAPKESPVLLPVLPLPVPVQQPQQAQAIAQTKALEQPISTSPIPLPKTPDNGVPEHATAEPVPPKTAPDIPLSTSSIPPQPTADPLIQRPTVPYLTSNERTELMKKARYSVVKSKHLSVPVVVHVNFTAEERRVVLNSAGVQTDKELWRLLNKASLPAIQAIVNKTKTALPSRTLEDIRKYLFEYPREKTSKSHRALVMRPDMDDDAETTRQEEISSLLLMREITGHRQYGGTRCHLSFAAASTKLYEDGLALRERWNGCAGDISTITWVSNDVFVCGTTEHSDSHNQQYNKPGNLVLGTCSTGRLQAFPDHRIVRPQVTAGENARVGMRESQSPWLYTSVVSSDHDPVHRRTYTAGFDRTVKIWNVESSQMKLLGEWVHDGNVNFVVASKHASGMVATGADVPSSAIRVYDFRDGHVSQSPYRSFSCSKTDENGNIIATNNKWAYFPATMQWGLAPEVQSFLLVGYSPRSLVDDDNDIPAEMLDTGELCVWDMLSGEKWEVTSVTHRNIFEVLWHPTHSSFIAATSPKGLPTEKCSVRTQIRVFSLMQNPKGGGAAFCRIKVLDCNAVDINELTIKPNSPKSSYITAGCTDGNVYVWDSGLPQDGPIHILRHGNPIDEYRGDREKEDTGVKFTAWGKSPHRFYTGSSDGIVKVWDLQAEPAVLVRNLLECPAPVSYGMFSPDMTKLIIGDATGRVALFTTDKEDDDKKSPFKLSAQYSKPILQHADPPPPPGEETPALPGITAASEFLRNGQLQLHKDPTIGAIQGPRYSQTGLFCRPAHRDRDPDQPLMAYEERNQQENQKMHTNCVTRRTLRPVAVTAKVKEQHAANHATEMNLPVVRSPAERSLEADHDFDVCATNADDFTVFDESDEFFSLGMDFKEMDMQEHES